MGMSEHLGVPIPKLPGFCTSYPIPVLTLQSTTDMLGWVQESWYDRSGKGLGMLGHKYPQNYIVVNWLGSTIPYFVGPAGLTAERILSTLITSDGWTKAFLQDDVGRPVRNLSKPLSPGVLYSFNPGSDKGTRGLCAPQLRSVTA